MSSLDIPAGLREKLWPHQRDAVRFGFERLRGGRLGHTGLLRMPTGTGKTGVIAVLSVAVPPGGWTLVLTPWKNLCVQMIDDLKEGFWKGRGWFPETKPQLERLYPKNFPDVLQSASPRLILLSTFAGVGPGQATGKGALGFVPPLGSVAIDPAALGLPTGRLIDVPRKTVLSEIESGQMLSKYGIDLEKQNW